MTNGRGATSMAGSRSSELEHDRPSSRASTHNVEIVITGRTRYNNAGQRHGCQMEYFQTKNPNLGKFRRVLQCEMLVNLIDIWTTLQRFDTLYVHRGNLVHFPTLNSYYLSLAASFLWNSLNWGWFLSKEFAEFSFRNYKR
jgi:hypothetical protein